MLRSLAVQRDSITFLQQSRSVGVDVVLALPHGLHRGGRTGGRPPACSRSRWRGAMSRSPAALRFPYGRIRNLDWTPCRAGRYNMAILHKTGGIFRAKSVGFDQTGEVLDEGLLHRRPVGHDLGIGRPVRNGDHLNVGISGHDCGPVAHRRPQSR